MWDAFFARRNFYNKCKSALRGINTRMENITKKRSATQKFLKNDVADLLRINQNACGRAQGLYMEMNLTWCYNYVQECCTLVTDNLKLMQTEIECPEECKVAVASLSYAAARFADLSELRDLRSLFTEKYGNTLDPYVNKEFAEKLKSNPPTREEMLKLMKDIAEEFSIAWNPASFEQYLQGDRVQQRVTYEQPRSNHASYYKENDRMQQNVFYERTPSSNMSGNVFYERTPSSNMSGYKENDRMQQNVFYERTSYSNPSGYKEVDQTRPYTSNRVNAPYVKLKGQKEDESEESDREKALMDKVVKAWRKPPSRDRTDGPIGTHVHPKLPDYDELASRMQALKNM